VPFVVSVHPRQARQTAARYHCLESAKTTVAKLVLIKPEVSTFSSVPVKDCLAIASMIECRVKED
jgi:hypothetical protein